MNNNIVGGKIKELFDKNLANGADGKVDVSLEVCPLITGSIEAAKVALKEYFNVDKGVIDGMEGVEDGSNSLMVTRSSPMQWTQSLFIIVQPTKPCIALFSFERIAL